MGTNWLDLTDRRRSAEHLAIARLRNCHHRHLLQRANPATRCMQHCYLKLMQVPIATEQPHTPASTIAFAYWQPLVRTSTALFA